MAAAAQYGYDPTDKARTTKGMEVIPESSHLRQPLAGWIKNIFDRFRPLRRGLTKIFLLQNTLIVTVNLCLNGADRPAPKPLNAKSRPGLDTTARLSRRKQKHPAKPKYKPHFGISLKII